ncbi:MAG: hypothetical protein ABJN52_11900 [Litorimonas sp.]
MDAEVIEVSIDFISEAVGYAARVFPWENVLIEATRPYRKQPLTVVRHLNCDRVDVFHEPTQANFLGIDSRPGEIYEDYDFKREINFVYENITNDVPGLANTHILESPNRKELEHHISTTKPKFVHIAALDTSYAFSEAEHLGIPETLINERTPDGIIVSGDDNGDEIYHVVSALDLSEILTLNGNKPSIVSIATCHSAGRIAAMAVANGAGSALGIDGVLDDTFAGNYFPAFYRHFREQGWNLLPAFIESLKQFQSTSFQTSGTPVLWSSVQLVHAVSNTKRKRKRPNEPTPDKIVLSGSDINVEVIVKEELNYCAMHNGQSPFEKFTIGKLRNGTLKPLDVKIELVAGNDSAQWRQRVKIKDDLPSLNVITDYLINLPLSARALRSVNEIIQTSIYIDVSYDGENIWSETLTTKLLPVDQWLDTDAERVWLPSFVWPRDKAITSIIKSAERHLKVISDDSSLTFDGYQSARKYKDAVDLQVQAIWNSLLHDHSISYINPPPTYSKYSQRLRSPSAIIKEGRGTCLDLALLFCACLEYIGIQPVIILISGHAFPGWWQNFGEGTNFINEFSQYLAEQQNSGESSKEMSSSISDSNITDACILGQAAFPILLSNINRNALSVIETTRICDGGGFFNSMKEARGHLIYPEIFDAIIDIEIARTMKTPITPLPILENNHDG